MLTMSGPSEPSSAVYHRGIMEGLRASLDAQAKAVRVVSSGTSLADLADALHDQYEEGVAQQAFDEAQDVEQRKADAQAEAEAALEAVETADETALACYAAAESRIRQVASSSASYKKVEAMTAGKFKVKWRHRGPGIVDASQDTVPVWRKQKYREGSNRYANRGGSRREYYAKRPWLWQDNKKGKGKGKHKSSAGKGKRKGKRKGTWDENGMGEEVNPEEEKWKDSKNPQEKQWEEEWEEDWTDPQEEDWEDWEDSKEWWKNQQESSMNEASSNHGASSSSSSSHGASSGSLPSESWSSAAHGLTSYQILGL